MRQDGVRCVVVQCVRLFAYLISTFLVIRMSSGVTIGVLTLPEVLRFCVLHSMSQVWQLGRAIERAKSTHSSVIDTIVEQQQGTLIIVGKVGALGELNFHLPVPPSLSPRSPSISPFSLHLPIPLFLLSHRY